MKYRISKGTSVTRRAKDLTFAVVKTERECVFSDGDRITKYETAHYYRFKLPIEALPYTFISVYKNLVKHEN